MGSTTDVHGEVELLVPGHGTGEGCLGTKVYGDVAISHSDTVVIACTDAIAVVVGLSPQQCSPTGSVVELELDVVVAIRGNGPSSCFQTSLEVQVVTGGSIRVWHTHAPAREEKQGEKEQNQNNLAAVLRVHVQFLPEKRRKPYRHTAQRASEGKTAQGPKKPCWRPTALGESVAGTVAKDDKGPLG